MSEAVTEAVADNEIRLNDRYSMKARIGKGGEGEVWEGFDHQLGKRVALKILKDIPLERDKLDEAKDRFAEEAKVTARSEHSNIIPVYDLFNAQVGDRGEKTVMVMSYRNPETSLDRLLAKQQVPFEAAHAFAYQAADAVESIHARDNIHGDIGPNNFFLEELIPGQWHATVIDLGASREVEAKVPRGEMVGKPAYAAPEFLRYQIKDDPRSDVYSLGSVLFEILAGKRRNPGENPMEAGVWAVRHDGLTDENIADLEAGLKQRKPDLTQAEIDRITNALDRATKNKPDQRFSSMMVLARAVFPTPPSKSSKIYTAA